MSVNDSYSKSRVHYRDSPSSSQLHTLSKDSGFPTARQTLSHWQLEQQRSLLSTSVDRAYETPDVNDWIHAETIDIADSVVDDVVIGGGISGSLIAWNLLRQSSHSSRSVTLLEARSASSGATGRNGGHCRPDSYAGYTHYTRMFHGDTRMAHKVLANEQATFELMDEIITQEGLQDEVDWWKGRTYSVFLSDQVKEKARNNYETYRDDGYLRPGDGPGQVEFIEDEEEAKKVTRVKDAVGAAGFNAGSLYPLRFTHAILRRSIKMGLRLYTHTPAMKIEPCSNTTSGARWTVRTPRGIIRARNVVLATNGYTSALLPSLSTFLTPHRAQACSIVPPNDMAPLSRTYSIAKAPGDYEYLVQRPTSRGSYWILGGGHTACAKEWQIGHWDDGVVSEEIEKHLEEYAGKTFQGWSPSGAGADSGVKEVHTGIQGYTRDSVPIVGEHPGLEGLFLDVGHHGHGMARAATVSRGVAALVAHGGATNDLSDAQWEEVTHGLPSCFRWTENRAKREDVDEEVELLVDMQILSDACYFLVRETPLPRSFGRVRGPCARAVRSAWRG